MIPVTPLDALVPGDVPRARWLFAALRGDAEVAGFDREQWRGACELALRMFAGPLLHALLGRRGLLDRAPEEVVVRLARSRAWSAARWERSAEQCRALGRAMEAAGVRAIVLKGAHVGWLHRERGARGTADIDLLVTPDHVPTAAAVLGSLGYVSSGWEVHADHRHLPAFLLDGGLPVELHRTLARREEPTSFADAVLARARPLPQAPGLWAMDLLDALLYTCKHLGAHHRFETTNALAGLSDVAVLVEACVPDADTLASRAVEWGIPRAVGLCLLLARDLLGGPVPDALIEPLVAPGMREAAVAATASVLRVGWLATTRELQLPARATLVPGLPVTGLSGPHPARGLATFLEQACLPPLDDLRTEFPALGGTPLAGLLGYPSHWSRLAWRHLGLVQWASPAVRRRIRDRHRRDARLLREYLG